MTFFRCPLGRYSRNSEDLKVLLVGFASALLIFSFVSMVDTHVAVAYVDLVLIK